MLLTVGQMLSGAIFLILMLFFVLLSLISLVVSIYMVYWTYNDATSRGMDNPELWALIVFFGNLIGFVAYLVVRE
jgi:hypothetical protein